MYTSMMSLVLHACAHPHMSLCKSGVTVQRQVRVCLLGALRGRPYKTSPTMGQERKMMIFDFQFLLAIGK